jgi:ornithine cyclodeaminase/alanine dehydrogenase-like protein (mu-crystallin family)
MTLLLSEDDVRVLLDMPTALEAVEESFRRQASGDDWCQPRRRLMLPDHVFFNYMAAADRTGGYVGAKLYTAARGGARFLVVLYRAGTGELAALIEADYLGQMRTGAATGVATKYMSRQNSRVCGILGTGTQARTQLEAVAQVRRFERIRAFGRDPVRRADFCRDMSERLDVMVTPATSAEDAVSGVDIVITATRSSQPVLLGAWLAPGVHVNAMGANMAEKRELDSEAVARAGTLAVDSIEQARTESGDLIHAFGNDESRWENVCELAQIVSGKIPGRKTDQEITLFKSNGIAIWDIAVASRVFERAEKEDVGRKIPFGELDSAAT